MVLARVLGEGHRLVRAFGEVVCPLVADGAVVVEDDRVTVLEPERGGVRPTLRTANRSFAGSFDDRLGPWFPTLGALVVDEGDVAERPLSAMLPVEVAMLVTSTSLIRTTSASPGSAFST
jgi:hypothetical protein